MVRERVLENVLTARKTITLKNIVGSDQMYNVGSANNLDMLRKFAKTEEICSKHVLFRILMKHSKMK